MITPTGALLAAATSRHHRGGVIVNEHTLDVAETRKHVDVLGRWFDFVQEREVPERLERPGRRPFCLLTFDDGKRQNATETAPALERLGVPAVFYVVARFLDGGEPLWFDDYEALVEALGAPPRGLERSTVKQLPFAILMERLERALAVHGVRADRTSDEVRAMSWDDARRLHERGFAIGAHSLHHAILPRETTADALADVRESIAAVTEQLGVPCRTFAFPNGNYTAQLARCARRVRGRDRDDDGAHVGRSVVPPLAAAPDPALPRSEPSEDRGEARACCRGRACQPGRHRTGLPPRRSCRPPGGTVATR